MRFLQLFIFVVSCFFCFDSQANPYYPDWQKYVPEEGRNWQKYVPEEGRNWQKYVPEEGRNWQKYVPEEACKYIPKNYNSHNERGRSVLESGTSDVYYGPTSINNKKIENLTILGPAFITNSNITGCAIVKGPAEIKNSSLHRLEVDGIANLDNVVIQGELFIHGPVYAYNSELNKVSIASDEMVFSGSFVGRIFVMENGNYKKQFVFLKNGAEVHSIEFEANNGRVILEDSSCIVQEVLGGEIKYSEK